MPHGREALMEETGATPWLRHKMADQIHMRIATAPIAQRAPCATRRSHEGDVYDAAFCRREQSCVPLKFGLKEHDRGLHLSTGALKRANGLTRERRKGAMIPFGAEPLFVKPERHHDGWIRHSGSEMIVPGTANGCGGSFCHCELDRR